MKKNGIVGHGLQLDHIEMMLRNNKIPQTLLFSGIPGIGKRRIALRFLKALFCSGEAPPCLGCPSCLQIMNGTHPDVIELAPNAKGTIPIGDAGEPGTVRWLIDRLAKRSISGRYGVIVNGVDHIAVQGQNALLKTIEEPSDGTVIVLVTSNKSLILPTILSRSTEIPFYQLSSEEVLTILKSHGIDVPHATAAAEMAGGSVELAVMLTEKENLDDIITLTEEICRFARHGGFLNLAMDNIQKKIGIDNVMSIAVNVFRSFLLSALGGTASDAIFAHIDIPDEDMIRRIIKIFLALRKGLTVNLNITQALKSMLYSMQDMNDTGLPDLTMAHIDTVG